MQGMGTETCMLGSPLNVARLVDNMAASLPKGLLIIQVTVKTKVINRISTYLCLIGYYDFLCL